MTEYLAKRESKIAPWGDRADVREIARRVQIMAPGARKLSENEALALAQGAVAHGLDPFNGEIWYIPGSGLMAGIKGLRKAARAQIAGTFWVEFEQLNDPDERALLDIPQGALAYRAILRDSETIRAYAEGWSQMRERGVPDEIIPDVLGQRPYTEGVGYIKQGESTKMDRVQVAMKRAEADALKRRFDLPFATPTEPNGEVVEGEWHSEATPEERAEEAKETLFGPADEERDVPEGDPDRPDPETTIKALREDADRIAATNPPQLEDDVRGGTIGSLEKAFVGDRASSQKRHIFTAAAFGKDSFTDLTDAEVLALKRFLRPHKDSGGDWLIDEDAGRAVRAVVRQRMLELGQTEMDLDDAADETA